MKDLSDAVLRLAVQHSPVGMMLVSTVGELLAVNDSACAMLGRERSALVGVSLRDLTHPDDLALGLELAQATMAGERSSYRVQRRYLCADGGVMWGDLSSTLLRDEAGAPLHFVAQIIDVTEQHLADERLARAHATIEKQARTVAAIYDAVDVGLVLIDRSGRYEQVNRRHHEFMALAYPEGHHGMAGQAGEVFAADGATRMRREDLPSGRAALGDEFDDVRLWVGTDPDTRRALSVSARSTRAPDGTLAGAALAYKDVTDFMRALHVKDEFVASVSHELRTPLTSVLGHLEMLVQRDDLPADAHAQVQVVERNAVRLGSLVADLLQVAQGRDGNLHVVLAPSDVAAVVREAVEAARPLSASSGVSLTADLPDTLVTLCDDQRARQVADNLVSNAIKYTDEGGDVHVRLGIVDDRVELVVSDTGIGIAKVDRDRLFSRFFRADDDRVRVTAGTGLGLNIVRSIVEACGGQVTVDSEVGEGSTFTAWVPYLPAG